MHRTGPRDTGQLVDLLSRWCRIPTHAAADAGLRAMADALVAALTPIAGRIELDPVGPDGLPVVRAWSRPRSAAPVLLVGHYDTVPHDGPGTQPDVELRDGRVFGRGTADMKGGLVVMIEALSRVESRHDAPEWEVVIVPDEEIGTPWSRPLLLEAATQAAAALVFEPATADGGLVRRRKGVGTVTVDVVGRSAHAGRNPWEGRSAVATIAQLIPVVESLADRDAGTYVNVTTLEGGTAANVIAAHARMQVDVRVDSATESDRVLEGIIAAAQREAALREVEIQVTGGLHRPAMALNEAAQALVTRYRAAAAAGGRDITWTDVGGGSDANLVAQAGIPVLDGLGVRGGDLHGPGEYAEMDSLDERSMLASDLLAAIPGLLGP